MLGTLQNAHFALRASLPVAPSLKNGSNCWRCKSALRVDHEPKASRWMPLAVQDTVAVQELRFGDNDTLSAQVHSTRGHVQCNSSRRACMLQQPEGASLPRMAFMRGPWLPAWAELVAGCACVPPPPRPPPPPPPPPPRRAPDHVMTTHTKQTLSPDAGCAAGGHPGGGRLPVPADGRGCPVHRQPKATPSRVLSTELNGRLHPVREPLASTCACACTLVGAAMRCDD